ncbi:MAG: FIST C-terminal domain-containing protein [Oscillospiraceae bacterium]|nr:FIST C-terminal domain-containing protein [Oscillospiraceae bacterium]
MFKAYVGTSTNPDPRAAGKEAAEAVKAGAIKAAFVYASCDYDIPALLEAAGAELPGVPLFGNTSFTGVIVPEGYVGGDRPFVGILAFADDSLVVGVAAESKDGCSVCKGKAIAQAAMAAAGRTDAPDYFYMAASPAEEEKYLEGIQKVIGRRPFFGGSAADNSIEGKWLLYADGKCFADGCVAAFFWGGPKMANKFTGAYRETADYGVITKLGGERVLAEIDGVPATEKYAAWRGLDREAVSGGNLLATTITSPLGVKDRLGKLIAIRHPMGGNPDGSMNIGNVLSEKTVAIRMEATVDELIDSTGETLKALIGSLPGKPLAFHLVHCGGRRAGIGDRIGEVAEQLKAAAGDVPFLCEFTFGEYGFERDGENACGGLMLSFTAFYE